MNTHQESIFGIDKKYIQLSLYGDPLEKLNEVIDWEIFRTLLNRAKTKVRKNNSGRRAYDYVMMFKVLVLQSLYNLSDGQTEYQIKDRLSFMRFLDIGIEDNIPDEKTIWLFREDLKKAKILEKLFNKFNDYLETRGFCAELGSIIDASIIEVPKQRNSKETNAQIKKGEMPKCIKKNKFRARQKDMEARWTVKNGKSYYGYKDHIAIDVKHKLIRKYEVTTSSVGDVNYFEKLLDQKNEDKRVWADSAYYSSQKEKMLTEKGYLSRVIRSFQKHYPSFSNQARENHRRGKIRKRIEHVFGYMENSMGRKFIRTIGLARAKIKIGLMNLVYNMCRYSYLCRRSVS